MRRVVHIIKEEDLSPLASDVGDTNLSAGNDEVEDIVGKGKCKLVWYFNSHRENYLVM